MRKKYYEDVKENAAFERCADVITSLILKYGPALKQKWDLNEWIRNIQAESLLKDIACKRYQRRDKEVEKVITLEEALKRIEELENENTELREELEYYKNRKLSGRQKHNAKWMAIYNDFVDCYENGVAMIEIAKRNNVSERTIYRYKAYYDKMRNTKENVIE